MQRVEVSCAVRHIYVFRRQRVNDAFYVRIRGIVVGVKTSFGMDGPGFESRQERGISSLKFVDRFRGPTSLLFREGGWGNWSYFQGVKPQRREVDQSPTSSAEVKNEWRNPLFLHASLTLTGRNLSSSHSVRGGLCDGEHSQF